jgi:hypothetical protein
LIHVSLFFVPTCSATSAQFPNPYISIPYRTKDISELCSQSPTKEIIIIKSSPKNLKKES